MVELPHITANQTNPVYLVYLRQLSVLPVSGLCYAKGCNDGLPIPAVYPGNTNLNNLNPPSQRAIGYIGFHCT